MITNDTVAHLAHLARIAITEEEKESLKNDLEKILAYVEEINQVDTGESQRNTATQAERRNVTREDEINTQAGEYTKSLVDSAPKHKDNYITVKKIISQD